MRGRPAKKSKPKPETPQEKPIEEEKVMTEEKKSVEKIYWAPARKYALHLSKKDPMNVGPYQREERDARGNVIQPAIPITFGESIFSTKDPDVQAVIENSRSFENGEIVLCVDIDDAMKRTAAQHLQKTVTSGMVTMADNSGRIASAEEAQSEIGKYQTAGE